MGMAWEGFGILHQQHRTSEFVLNLTQLLLQTLIKVLSPSPYLSLTVSLPHKATLYVLLRWYLISALPQQSEWVWPPACTLWLRTFCFSVCCSAGAHAGLCLCILLLACTAPGWIGGKITAGGDLIAWSNRHSLKYILTALSRTWIKAQGWSSLIQFTLLFATRDWKENCW